MANCEQQTANRESQNRYTMCTVTYIPNGAGSFILTTNRDEQAVRSPKDLSKVAGVPQLLFPRDGGAGGSWVVTSDTGQAVCILNGAFERHQRRSDYRLSRGIMALAFFAFPSVENFVQNFDFQDIEPFTMIIYEPEALYELRWDEQRPHLKALDIEGYHIWSSATLYEPLVQAKREQWFADWLRGRQDFSLDAIMDFHQNAGDGDPWNDVVMNRGFVQTVSITNIIKTPHTSTMRYHDLLRGAVKQDQLIIPF